MCRQTDRKDLSAVQLLGKRDNVASSREELNGRLVVIQQVTCIRPLIVRS